MKRDGPEGAPSIAQLQNLSPVAGLYIHSDVWDRLMSSADELTAIVAYGFYQREKREWIDDYKQKNGHIPSTDEVKQFSSGYRAQKLRALVESANGALALFNEEITKSQIPEMQRKAFNLRTSSEIAIAREQLKALTGILQKRTGIWHHVIMHTAGFIVIAILAVAVIFAIDHEFIPKEFAKHVLGDDRAHQANEVANTPSTDAKQDAATLRPKP